MSSFMQDTRDPEEDLGLLELLGEGSYGAVYRAERRTDGMEVAVKIIPADNPADLLKEVDIMLACASPYIVRLHDCYYKDSEAWLVMDFVGGGSVSDILEACEVTLSEEEARDCTAWTVLALDYLHSNRKLHRDVKAGNVLITLDGRAKLADFGVSKEVSTMANKAQTAIGTPYWMAPEVIQEVPYDGQADIWSLAITCIEMVEGNPPLHNVHPMRAIFMIPSKPSPKLSEPAKWSLEFNDFIARCLEKKPEDRPSSRAILRHPWIAASVEAIQSRGGEVGSPVIRDLVAEHLPVLTAFREDASDAKASLAGEASEDCSGPKAATLRRMSSTRAGDTFRGNGALDARSPAAANISEDSVRGRSLDRDDDFDGDSNRSESCNSGESVIRVPVDGGCEEVDEDGYSSGGSMIRVPVDVGGDQEEDDEGYSSGGSVVRVPVDAGKGVVEEDGYSSGGSVIRVSGNGEAEQEEDACSSDGSVVRVPLTKGGSAGDAEASGQEGQGGEGMLNGSVKARGLGVHGEEMENGCNEESVAEQGGAKRGPANAMKMNLQAAAKYFGKGGQGSYSSGTGTATEGQSNGSAPVVQKAEECPQAKALRNELERLDIAFANDLSRLRQTYDTRKAELQAELRGCLDRQPNAAAAVV